MYIGSQTNVTTAQSTFEGGSMYCKQENEQVSQNISNELRILKGSSRITSTNDIEVKKARRFSEDPFKDNQHDISVSSLDCANEVSPVVEQEGSSTSDDTSLESIIEANLEEDQNETEA
jgi:hypothetical protein